MLPFYRKATAIFLGLVVLTALVAALCARGFFVSDALFPANESVLPWKLKTFTDAVEGGSSTVSVTEDVYGLDYEYILTESVEHPVVTAAVAFSGPGDAPVLVDLSRYSTATFRVKCMPRNALAFFIYSFDAKVTNPGNFYSYRGARAFFSCLEEWSDVEIDLKHLNIPPWWLESVKLDPSDQDYRLDKVIAIAFGASRDGLVNTPSKVKIGGLTLHGHDWRYAWIFAGFSTLAWIGFASWFFRHYTSSLLSDVKSKLKKDQPLMAYQRLSIEPHRDKEKSQVLQFMAAQYRNPDISLEFAVETLGINRTKINELLKDELGMTFSAYLNKLRLSEAARLLSQRDDTNVEEIAHSVGYSDVSYFRKLFKNEYGCTPGTFARASPIARDG
ncbi:MAG TPA: AraC family transcriptional regulator [Gammaproteobacteria bacterium]|nr:AraC family transcriptional regulator [Gammaproteobacteria bacterium]